MANRVAVLFTAKSVETLLKEGGTSSWRIDWNHARHCEFAVCTRNAKARWVEGPEPHHSAFLIGKVSDVVHSPTDKRKGRYLLQFSEYAEVNIPNVWKGERNPVKYAESLEDLGIDPSDLKWKKMPAAKGPQGPPQPVTAATGGLTIAEAKRGLSQTFGVSPDAIEITIRG